MHTHGPYVFVGTTDLSDALTADRIVGIAQEPNAFSFSDSAAVEIWLVQPADEGPGGTVRLIDANSFDALLLELTSDQVPFEIGGIVATPTGAWLYSADPESAQLARLDPATRAVTRVVDLDRQTGITSSLSRVNYDEAWVGTTDGHILELDAATGAVLAAVQVSETAIVDLARRGAAIVALDRAGALYQVDPASLEVTPAELDQRMLRIGSDNAGGQLAGLTTDGLVVLLAAEPTSPLSPADADLASVGTIADPATVGDLVIQAFPPSVVATTPAGVEAFPF